MSEREGPSRRARGALGRAPATAAATVIIAAVVAAVSVAGLHAARADGFTDTELSGRASDAYLEGDLAKAGSLDDADYRELARVDDKKSGVQAIALERRRDHAVVVAYAGTDVSEPADVLADLGLVAGEIRYLVDDSLCAVRHPLAKARARAAPPCAGAAHERADRLRAAGPRVPKATRAMDDQLAVSRRFLDEVLATKNLDGRTITVADVTVTGHSLGGFIAQIVAAEHGARGVTFNGPGAQHYAPALHSLVVRNLVRRHDVVGNFGVHIGTTEYWDDVPLKAGKGESKLYIARNHSIAAFHASLEQAGA